jgi:hypothetical protein
MDQQLQYPSTDERGPQSLHGFAPVSLLWGPVTVSLADTPRAAKGGASSSTLRSPRDKTTLVPFLSKLLIGGPTGSRGGHGCLAPVGEGGETGEGVPMYAQRSNRPLSPVRSEGKRLGFQWR